MKNISNKIGIILIILITGLTIIAIIYIQFTYMFYPITDKDNIVVVEPIFTSTAYQSNGFYEYFKSKCGMECLTIKINNTLQFTSSKNALDIFKWNGIDIITDIDIDRNPEILTGYSTVILLHSEYVTQREFNAITSHPKVVYLYPNSLYGKIEYDNYNNKITLIRGHNYPENEITNGFDWKYDNTKQEYDRKCLEWNFTKIDNGYMLNCYPENSSKLKQDILIKLNELIE